MDTRFWGPSGWKLLHLITFYYDNSEHQESYANFFETLPYILPCKFCRASLTDFYELHPFITYTKGRNIIEPGINLKKWLYKIHQCINNKLHKQGLYPHIEPAYKDVCLMYESIQKESWNTQLLYFWDFLFAIAYNHPKETKRYSTSMPNCPKEAYESTCTRVMNKWNILSLKYRIYWYKRFWIYLPGILPKEIGKRWINAEITNPPTLQCRRSSLAWLWRMRCILDGKFTDPYHSVCKSISKHSSDCGVKPKAITCRRTKMLKKK